MIEVFLLVRVPVVLDINPLMVNVLLPIDRLPFCSVRVPPVVTLPDITTPLARLMVRLFRIIAGKFVEEPVPPKVRLEELPPVRLPDDIEIGPFSVRVFAPIENAPEVRYKVPLRLLEA